jgi:hypothetical protein
MEQWIEVAKVYGPLAFIALALGLFLYRNVWPLVVKRIEDADKERVEFSKRLEDQGRLFADSLKFDREYNTKRFDEQGRLFTEALRTQNVFAAESHKEITQELKSIHERLRNGR